MGVVNKIDKIPVLGKKYARVLVLATKTLSMNREIW